jgi:hypothetical protein
MAIETDVTAATAPSTVTYIKTYYQRDKCKHQCSKCGILYNCEGCLKPFFDKHDCKLKRSSDTFSIITLWIEPAYLENFAYVVSNYYEALQLYHSIWNILLSQDTPVLF